MDDDGAVHERRSRGGGGGESGQHFLIVAYGVQSHVNPGRVLAHSLARLDAGGGSGGPVLATLSLPLFAHRRLFPSPDGGGGGEEEEATDGVVSYAPYSDGFDDGAMRLDAEERARGRRATFESLSAVVARLAARGRPVTCVVSSMVMLPALDVGRERGIPLAVYWIQPATVLAVAYHYFHGHEHAVTSHAADRAFQVNLPGLRRPLRIRDFPSFLVDTEGGVLPKIIKDAFEKLSELMDKGKAKVLANTFHELEPAALAEMKQHLDVFAVGPMIGSPADARIHLFDHHGGYMEWLDAQPARSVVYVSFGSILTHSKRQVEEILRGLRQCGRPYLWVVRGDGGRRGLDGEEEAASHAAALAEEAAAEAEGEQGMVVEWCDQVAVLSHAAVGCFVTHCGWNSTLEAMVLGVPVVAVPSWLDQPTNAFLVEEEWAVGARAERDGEGVLAGDELARCVELVMGDGESAMRIRESAGAMRGMAQAAGGPARGSLQSFVMAVQACQDRSSPDKD